MSALAVVAVPRAGGPPDTRYSSVACAHANSRWNHRFLRAPYPAVGCPLTLEGDVYAHAVGRKDMTVLSGLGRRCAAEEGNALWSRYVSAYSRSGMQGGLSQRGNRC